VHLNTLAGEVERAMAALNAEGSASLGQATPQAPQLSRIDPARGYTPDAAGGTRKPSGWPCLPQQRRSQFAHGGDG